LLSGQEPGHLGKNNGPPLGGFGEGGAGGARDFRGCIIQTGGNCLKKENRGLAASRAVGYGGNPFSPWQKQKEEETEKQNCHRFFGRKAER